MGCVCIIRSGNHIVFLLPVIRDENSIYFISLIISVITRDEMER